MDFLEQDKECCGASFEKNHISLLGLITFCVPLFYISSILVIILFPLQLLFKTAYRFSIQLYHANTRLIQSKNILSRTKCEWSGKLFTLSPFIAGIFYKTFNFIILHSIIFIILFVTLIIKNAL